MFINKITWEQFMNCSYNESEGITKRFEDLCRQILYFDLISHNKEITYIHCNPNNPGLESDQIFDEENNIYIGFQAKFFKNRVDYENIKSSLKKIIDKYKYKVNKVYLFCNLSIDRNCKSYKNAEKILLDKGIEVELVTNEVILDRVREYDNLARYYFEVHNLDDNYLKRHNKNILDRFGERYNTLFNINTDTALKLSIFSRDDSAACYMNNKKILAIKELDKIDKVYNPYKEIVYNLKKEIRNIDDINYKNIEDVFKWREKIEKILDEYALNRDLIEINEEIKDLNKTEEDDIKIKELKYKKETIEILFKTLENLEPTKDEELIIKSKILIITGKAGMGKTHLLANEMKELMDDNRIGIILSGNSYLENKPIREQIASEFGNSVSFDEILEIMNMKGFINNSIVPIYIDALNETFNKALWKNDIPYIFNKIKEFENLRLVVSYREEYKESLFGEYKFDDKDIQIIEHNGFSQNSIEATKEFLNNYNIPFTPISMFNMNITNPLFLTLYCKTYGGDNIDIQTLYEKILKIADKNIYKNIKQVWDQNGYNESSGITEIIVLDIVKKFLNKKRIEATYDELSEMNIWNKLRLPCITMLNCLVKENILNNYMYNNNEIYEFSYDQMNDYYFAKFIIEKNRDKESILDYIENNILYIDSQEKFNEEDIGILMNICSLYAEKFNEECINIIEKIEEIDYKEYIFESYVKSFEWRKNIKMKVKDFLKLCEKYKVEVGTIWNIFIMNSLNEDSCFNSEELHKVLFKYELNTRDYLWTIYINELDQDSNRLIQLIKMYANGEKLENVSNVQIKLLLILFAWLLSSSNRYIRDLTSKAMIEILKEHFEFCEIIIKKFEGVNDPYIFQRLYGIVWGACSKRRKKYKKEYKNLAIYVYESIFKVSNVYPDILLRDYARLIIERFIYEFNDEKEYFDKKIIIPPYKSENIPNIEDKEYWEMEFKSNEGLYEIVSSMTFDVVGSGCLYGDFGRYVFQRALDYFEIDHYKIFNYSIDFIINTLKYDNNLFGKYDISVLNNKYKPYIKSNIERIGKKYQWITMYNIIARVSDNYNKKIDTLDMYDSEIYEGTWKPYLRDFDPTLNSNNMSLEKELKFENKDNFSDDVDILLESENEKNEWISEYPKFLDYKKSNMIFKEKNETEWIFLINDSNIQNDNYIEKLKVWSYFCGYFIKEEQYNLLKNYIESKCEIKKNDLNNIPSTYTVFSREYPWFESSKEITNYSWKSLKVKTGYKEKVEKNILIPYFYYENQQDSEINEVLDFKEKKIEVYEEKLEDIGKVLCTSARIVWEEEFDKSKKDTISYYVPCKNLIQNMNLEYGELDGVFYDKNGSIASFDTSYIKNKNRGLVIRKDILDEFLKKKNYKLIYFVTAEKRIIDTKKYNTKNISEWTGTLEYNFKEVVGDIFKINKN